MKEKNTNKFRSNDVRNRDTYVSVELSDETGEVVVLEV